MEFRLSESSFDSLVADIIEAVENNLNDEESQIDLVRLVLKDYGVVCEC